MKIIKQSKLRAAKVTISKHEDVFIEVTKDNSIAEIEEFIKKELGDYSFTILKHRP